MLWCSAVPVVYRGGAGGGGVVCIRSVVYRAYSTVQYSGGGGGARVDEPKGEG